MADPVQWTIDRFWAELQNLENIAVGLRNNLNANKARLQALYTKTRLDPDPVRRAHNQALLTPLIHQNSVLRLSYLQPIVSKFNQAVQAASAALKSAGYTTPHLSGLGFAVIVAPLAAVTILGVALSLAYVAERFTHTQNVNTDVVARIIDDPHTTVDEKQRLLDAIAREQEAAAKNKPPGFDLKDLTPILFGVAAIMVLPTVLKFIPAPRSSEAA